MIEGLIKPVFISGKVGVVATMLIGEEIPRLRQEEGQEQEQMGERITKDGEGPHMKRWGEGPRVVVGVLERGFSCV